MQNPMSCQSIGSGRKEEVPRLSGEIKVMLCQFRHAAVKARKVRRSRMAARMRANELDVLNGSFQKEKDNDLH